MLLSREQLAAAMPGLARHSARLDAYLPHINAALAEADIATPKRIAAFLAQVGHESGDFRYMEEIWGPTKAQRGYDRRRDLGNTTPEAIEAARAHGTTPGPFYKGHGPLQVTGFSNHKAAGEALGVDAVNHPDVLASPEQGFRAAAWFWTRNGLNRYADRDQFETLTRRINGGLNGLDDRMQRWARAKRALASVPVDDDDSAATVPHDQPAADGAGVPEPPTTPAPSNTSNVVGEAQTVVNTAPGVATPTPGGAPGEPAKTAGDPPWKVFTKWLGTSLSLNAVTQAIASLTGLTPEAQLFLLKAGVYTALVLGVVMAVYWLLVKQWHARPDRANTQ